jgi:hypothetical protein
MKIKIISTLIITALAQATDLLSSSYKNNRHNQIQQQPKKSYAHKNPFTHLADSDSDENPFADLAKNSNSDSKIKTSRHASYQSKLTKPKHNALIEIINQDVYDSDSDSDNSTASDIIMYFGPENWSIHRNEGFMVKTKHLKPSAFHNYMNLVSVLHVYSRH